MPHKHNAGKRHHIPKAKFTVTSWSQYENGLKQRGSLTLWITPEAIVEWKAAARVSPGGQPRYSDLAIQAQWERSCNMTTSGPLKRALLSLPGE